MNQPEAPDTGRRRAPPSTGSHSQSHTVYGTQITFAYSLEDQLHHRAPRTMAPAPPACVGTCIHRLPCVC